jgi:hypothetical protein
MLVRPRSLMDKVLVFGTSDVGSIPAGGTNTLLIEVFELCGYRESNPSLLLGKEVFYH